MPLVLRFVTHLPIDVNKVIFRFFQTTIPFQALKPGLILRSEDDKKNTHVH
jgi:hypothetical protein